MIKHDKTTKLSNQVDYCIFKGKIRTITEIKFKEFEYIFKHFWVIK